jgi:hypothetical protein
MTATTVPRLCASAWLPILCATVLSTALAGCVQSRATSTKKAQPVPAVAAIATGAPVVLSGAAYTEGSLTPPPAPNAPPTPPATTDIVPVQPGTTPGAVVASTPPPVPALITAPTVPPAPEAPPPQVPQVPTTTADGFPNINVPPRQPEGQLLTPEERAKLIAELNALAGRGTGAQ